MVPQVVSVQLVNISTLTFGFMGAISIVNGGYKPTNITGGAPPCMFLSDNFHSPPLLLVGGWATPLKNMKVSWDDDSQYMEK